MDVTIDVMFFILNNFDCSVFGLRPNINNSNGFRFRTPSLSNNFRNSGKRRDFCTFKIKLRE